MSRDTCDDVRARLTAYLDGELEDDRGSAVRGHLRGCEACRRVATDEAALRDALRALPPVDPPPSLWANVQAQLAAAEIRDAEQPAWRRAVARWAPRAPRFGFAGAALAAAISMLVWRAHRHPADDAPPTTIARHDIAPVAPPAPPPPSTGDERDVTIELAAAPARQTEGYAAAAAELLRAAQDERAQWTVERQQAFDARIAVLRAQIDHASDERPRQHAYRALIRYLQGAAIRDEVALADTRGVP